MVEPYAPFDIDDCPERFGLRAQTVHNRFGRQFLVTDAPDGSDSVSLYLHGVGGAWSAWTPVLQAATALGLDLGPKCLVDLPGFGRSENVTGQLRAEDVAASLFELAIERDWKRISLIGHSMGGFLGLDAASRKPERLAGLTVFAGTYLSVLRTVQAPLRVWREAPATAIAYQAMNALARTGPASGALMHLLERSGLLARALSRGAAHADQLPSRFLAGLVSGLRPRSFVLAAKNGVGYDAIARWGRICVPVSAVFGDSDTLVPAADRLRVEKSLSNMTTSVLADCGHFALIERPFEVAHIIFDSLS